MRQIQFRAWDKQLKEMIPWSRLIWNSQGLLNALHNAGTPEPFGNWIAQQYTGLQDDNGKEIYEGDILKITNEWLEESIHEVKWCGDYPAFEIYPGDDNWEANNLMTAVEGGNYEKVQVIGNIYENPELLTRED